MDRKLKFEFKFGEVYIPDNSEEHEDVYAFEDFEDLCEESWYLSDDLQELYSSPQSLLEDLIDLIEWEYPETVIERLKDMD